MLVRSLQTRIVIAFTLLLLAVQSIGLVVIHTIASRNARGEIEEQLNAGERVFKLMWEENSRQLAQAATVLSSDFAFREAIATDDRRTVLWTLANHGARIKADLVTLVGLDNKVLGDTLQPDRVGQAFMFSELVAEAAKNNQATEIVMRNGSAYELVVVPVLAPLPIA